MLLGLSGASPAPDIREMPDYCMGTSFDPRSWFRGLLDVCAPYTQGELEAMTQSQASWTCRSAANPAACAESLIAEAAIAQHAAEATDPAGTCEASAVQEYPTLSRLLGANTVCGLYAGKYTGYLLAAAAALAAAMLLAGHRGRR